MKKIILTGFEPFAHYKYNPTQKSTEDFNGKVFGERKVIGVVLPCIYRAWGHLVHTILTTDPYAIICTGLASSVQGMRIESIFHNMMNGKYPDADGYNPKNIPILTESTAPSMVKSNPHSKKYFKLLADNDIPAEFSTDAERFICNSLGYYTSAAARAGTYNKRNLFVHVPWTTEYKDKVPITSDKNYLDKDLYYKGLELLIRNI